MKTKLTLLILLFLLSFIYEKGNAQGPAWDWAKSAGGVSTDQGYGVATDASGNVLVTGYFASDSITFGAITLINTGSTDMFVVKYDALGNVLWAKSNGGSGGNEYGSAITTDAGGNVLVAGSFSSTTLTLGAVTLSSAGSDDVFVVKYDASGNVLWAKRAGGNASDVSAAITTDASGNVLVTGGFRSPFMMFGAINLPNSNAGYREVFIAKYDAAGNPLWAKSAAGSLDEYSFGIATDPNGNTRVTGGTQSDSLTFGTTTLITSTVGNSDMYIVNYDASGNVLWAKSAGSNGTDEGMGVTTYPNGNTLVTGNFDGDSITFGTTVLTNANSALLDIFVVKYDASGNVLWAKSNGGTEHDYATGIDIDAGGKILVTGYFRSTSLTFGTTTLYHTGGSQTFDAYVVKYDAAGNALWAQSAGGANNEKCYGIATDAAGNVVVTGAFNSPSTAFGTTTLTNAGAGFDDVFVAKIGFCMTTATINPVSCNSYTSPSGNYTWTASGIYHDTLTSASGCDSVITINLTVNTVDTSVTQSGNILTASATGATYQWLDCNNSFAIINGATNQVFAPTAIGNYAASITINGCTDTSGCFAVIGVGISELKLINNIEIYPNPASDNITIKTNSNKKQVITISDITGQLIYSTTILSDKTIINTKDFPQGVYAVQVQAGESVETRKIIVFCNSK